MSTAMATSPTAELSAPPPSPRPRLPPLIIPTYKAPEATDTSPSPSNQESINSTRLYSISLSKALPPSPLRIPSRALLDPVSVAAIERPGPHRHLDQHPHPRVSKSALQATGTPLETIPRSKFSQASIRFPITPAPAQAPVKGERATDESLKPRTDPLGAPRIPNAAVQPPIRASPPTGDKTVAETQQRSRSTTATSGRSKFTEVDVEEARLTTRTRTETGSASSTAEVWMGAHSRDGRARVSALRTRGGHFQRKEFALFDPEGGPRLLTRRWGTSGGTRRTRVVFMAVGLVVVGASLVIGLVCAHVL